MNYLRLFYAIFIGALMTAATRFGPSLTIFAFVYLSKHSNEQAYPEEMRLEHWLLYYLPAASILIGGFAFLIRIALKTHSASMDNKTMPFVDYLVLRGIEKGSMQTVALRSQSVLGLRIAQTLLLLVILSLAIVLISPALSILSFCLIIFVVLMAVWWLKKGVTTANFSRVVQSFESMIEQAMVVAMVLGCVLFVPRSQWLHAAVGLFVIARFVASFRVLGKSILQWSIARQTQPIPARPLPVIKQARPVAAAIAVPPPVVQPPPTAATAPKPD